MNSEIIDKAFEEGQIIRSYLYNAQGDNAQKTIERFSYKFLESLRRKDSGDVAANLIRLYCNIDGRQIPEFFKELLKNISSMNQIGYAFLLGLNSYKEFSTKAEKENKESIEINEDKEEE
jgi:hypothetical protein